MKNESIKEEKITFLIFKIFLIQWERKNEITNKNDKTTFFAGKEM